MSILLLSEKLHELQQVLCKLKYKNIRGNINIWLQTNAKYLGFQLFPLNLKKYFCILHLFVLLILWLVLV